REIDTLAIADCFKLWHFHSKLWLFSNLKWFRFCFSLLPRKIFADRNTRIEESGCNQQSEKPATYLPVNQHLIVSVHTVFLQQPGFQSGHKQATDNKEDLYQLKPHEDIFFVIQSCTLFSWIPLQIDKINRKIQCQRTHQHQCNQMDQHIEQPQINPVPQHLFS